jgi:hypothetical protein
MAPAWLATTTLPAPTKTSAVSLAVLTELVAVAMTV